MQQPIDSKQLRQDHVPLEYLLGHKARHYLSPQRSSFNIPKNGKNFRFELSKVLNQRQREEKARKYLEEYMETPGTEVSLLPETAATTSIRLLKSPCVSKTQLFDGYYDGCDSLSNVGTRGPMVESTSPHTLEEENHTEYFQPVNVEEEVKNAQREAPSLSNLNIHGTHPYLVTDRKLCKEEKFALERQKQQVRAQMVQDMRARLAAQQENTKKIMKNVLPGTSTALRSQDDSHVERRNAAADQKHSTITHVRHEVEVQKEHLHEEIESAHEAKVKQTKKVRNAIKEKKMKAQERKLTLGMQHKERLEYLRKNKTGNASFNATLRVDSKQKEDVKEKVQDQKLKDDIPDDNQCSYAALVKNVPKVFSGGFGMKKTKVQEDNRDTKEQSDSVSTNDFSLDTKSVKSVQLQ